MSENKPARTSTRKPKSAAVPAKQAKSSAAASDKNPRAPKRTATAKSGTASKRSPDAARTSKQPRSPDSGSVEPRTSRLSDTAPLCLIRFPIEVRWRDLDAFNHVNNANFLTYVEEARLAWMQSLGGPWVTESTAPVLAAVQVNFRRPIAWPESLVVELMPRRVGSSSLTLAYRMVAAADASIVYSDGETVMVWVDALTGRAAPLPDAVRAGTDPDDAAP